jgi:hypothetical protein
MNVITTGRKSKHLYTLENQHTYKITKNNLHINDTHIEAHNRIFQTYMNFTIGSSTLAT